MLVFLDPIANHVNNLSVHHSYVLINLISFARLGAQNKNKKLFCIDLNVTSRDDSETGKISFLCLTTVDLVVMTGWTSLDQIQGNLVPRKMAVTDAATNSWNTTRRENLGDRFKQQRASFTALIVCRP